MRKNERKASSSSASEIATERSYPGLGTYTQILHQLLDRIENKLGDLGEEGDTIHISDLGVLEEAHQLGLISDEEAITGEVELPGVLSMMLLRIGVSREFLLAKRSGGIARELIPDKVRMRRDKAKLQRKAVSRRQT